MPFFPLTFSPTGPNPGLWTHFRGYIPSLPSCPHIPSHHLATMCLLWTASVAAWAHLCLSQKGRLLPNAESRCLLVPGIGRLACTDPFLNNLFLPAILKGEETFHFHVVNSQNYLGAWQLDSAVFSMGKQTYPCLANCSTLPKLGIAVKHFNPGQDLWQNGREQVQQIAGGEPGESTGEMKFGLKFMGG